MSVWKLIDNPPDKPVMVELFSGNVKSIPGSDGRDHLPDPLRDYRRNLGYWDGKYFRHSSTGHTIEDDCYNSTDWYPTHYRILPQPPEL